VLAAREHPTADVEERRDAAAGDAFDAAGLLDDVDVPGSEAGAAT
jgi:hypothetical protein